MGNGSAKMCLDDPTTDMEERRARSLPADELPLTTRIDEIEELKVEKESLKQTEDDDTQGGASEATEEKSQERIRNWNEEREELQFEIEKYNKSIAKCRQELENPSIALFRKKSLTAAVARYEGCIALRDLRIEAIDEDIESEERICKGLADLKDKIQQLKEEKEAKEKELQATSEELTRQISEKEALNSKLEEECEHRTTLEHQIEDLNASKEAKEREIQAMSEDLATQKSEMKALVDSQQQKKRKQYEQVIEELNAEKSKARDEMEVYQKCIQRYMNEIQDPRTNDRRRQQLIYEVQQLQAELKTKRQNVFNLERKLLGVDTENDGKTLSIATLHLIKYKDDSGRVHTFRLVDLVSVNWKKIGLILGVSQNQLDGWHVQYRGDSNSCWAKVMEFWLDGNGDVDAYPLTWEGAYTWLQDAELSVVADQLKMAVERASSEAGAAGSDLDAEFEEDIDFTVDADQMNAVMESMSMTGKGRLEKIIYQLNEAKGAGATETVQELESKLLGIMESEIKNEGSLSSGTLHLLKWSDKKGNKKTFRLVDRVSAKWKQFGTLLGISMNLLASWEKQYQGNANVCFTKVMEYWLNAGGKEKYPATWEGLYALLEDAEYVQVAEELRKAVDEATESANATNVEQLIKELNEKKRSGRDPSDESILDLEGKLQEVIEAEAKKKGFTLSIATLHLLKWVDPSGATKTFRLADRASMKWRKFGHIIGLAHKLEAWDQEYLGDVLKCWTRVMEAWLKMENDEYPATWEGLFTLLDDVELSAIRQELQQAVTEARLFDENRKREEQYQQQQQQPRFNAPRLAIQPPPPQISGAYVPPITTQPSFLDDIDDLPDNTFGRFLKRHSIKTKDSFHFAIAATGCILLFGSWFSLICTIPAIVLSHQAKTTTNPKTRQRFTRISVMLTSAGILFTLICIFSAIAIIYDVVLT